MTKTLPTITLDASSIELYHAWKVFFPYSDDSIRARLDGFGMRYEPELRASVLPDEDGLPAKLRAAFEQVAFVVVKK